VVLLIYVELAAFLCYLIIALIFSYRNQRGIFAKTEKEVEKSEEEKSAKPEDTDGLINSTDLV
jgi:predicted histidine transporter YuiF (NhaC family)